MMEVGWWKYKEWHQRIVLRWSKIHFYCVSVVFVLFHSCIIWQLCLYCISVVFLLCGSCILYKPVQCWMPSLWLVCGSGQHLPRWSGLWPTSSKMVGLWNLRERRFHSQNRASQLFQKSKNENITQEFLVLVPQWGSDYTQYWQGKYDWHHSWKSFVRTTVISDQHDEFLKMPQLSPRYGLPVWPPI